MRSSRSGAGGGERIPELDGFRVLMVGIVAWFHFWQQSWLTPYIGRYSLDYLVRAGYMCVDGTILLSAFLLFLPYARIYVHGGSLPGTEDFFRRRIMRIVPSYLFCTFLMLFAVVLPYRMYTKTSDLAYDVFMHVFMIFNWDRRTYLGTQLGGSSWTIAVEMQLYLLVPLLGRMAQKKPLAVMFCLCALSAYFRGWCVWSMDEFSMVVNQPVSFLDVYALGMALSFGYVHLRELQERQEGGRKWLMQLSATLVFLLSFWLFLRVLRVQARSSGYPAIQSGQMIRRPVLALTLGGMLLSLPFALAPLRVFFGNPVTRFLSAISMNFYLLHQNIAVHLRRLGIPYSEYDYPNQMSERSWQYRYTFLVIAVSLVLATLVTYLIEKPCAMLLRKGFGRIDARRARRKERRSRRAQPRTEDMMESLMENPSEDAAHADTSGGSLLRALEDTLLQDEADHTTP